MASKQIFFPLPKRRSKPVSWPGHRIFFIWIFLSLYIKRTYGGVPEKLGPVLDGDSLGLKLQPLSQHQNHNHDDYDVSQVREQNPFSRLEVYDSSKKSIARLFNKKKDAKSEEDSSEYHEKEPKTPRKTQKKSGSKWRKTKKVYKYFMNSQELISCAMLNLPGSCNPRGDPPCRQCKFRFHLGHTRVPLCPSDDSIFQPQPGEIWRYEPLSPLGSPYIGICEIIQLNYPGELSQERSGYHNRLDELRPFNDHVLGPQALQSSQSEDKETKQVDWVPLAIFIFAAILLLIIVIRHFFM